MNANDKQKILSIMRENSMHAYLATSDGDQPSVRPVSPIIGDNMSIWITTFCPSRKVKQIGQNPRICLAFVDQPNGDRSATVIGKAEVIDDMDEKKRVWKLATFDLSQHFTGGVESEEFCLLKISVGKIEWRDSWTSKLKTFKPSKE